MRSRERRGPRGSQFLADERMELRFLCETDRPEVDFVVLREGAPLFAVECTSGGRESSPPIEYFRRRTPNPRFCPVHLGARDFGWAEEAARVLPFHTSCGKRGMP
jgi:hypothetical protein